MTDYDKYTCDELGEDAEEHTCPFAQDVHNDSDTLCRCCDYCTSQCAADI